MGWGKEENVRESVFVREKAGNKNQEDVNSDNYSAQLAPANTKASKFGNELRNQTF